MNVWDILHGDIDNNLLRMLNAQAQAEERGIKTFPCPVCGGDVWWGRISGNGRMLCGCGKCGMYLRGENDEAM